LSPLPSFKDIDSEPSLLDWTRLRASGEVLLFSRPKKSVSIIRDMLESVFSSVISTFSFRLNEAEHGMLRSMEKL
jgi:hypothetical protein